MNYPRILATVIDIASVQLDVPYNSLTEETRYTEDLDADSLDRAELFMELEDTFNVDVLEEMPALRTIGETARYFAERLGVEVPGK